MHAQRPMDGKDTIVAYATRKFKMWQRACARAQSERINPLGCVVVADILGTIPSCFRKEVLDWVDHKNFTNPESLLAALNDSRDPSGSGSGSG